MEEKKVTKVSLSTFFLVLAIIAIGVMGFFIYKLNDDKTKESEKVSELNNQVKVLTNTVDELKTVATNSTTTNNTVDSNTTNSVNTNTSSNTLYTEEDVKQTAADYLELQSSIIPLDVLAKKGKINYDSSKDKMNTSNGEITTNVKFADYKNAMLSYVTESEFENNWISKVGLKEDSDGYVTHGQLGGGVRSYTIDSVLKIDENNYTVKTTSMVEDDSSTKSNKEFTFTVKSNNGNCVVDAVK